MASQQSGGFNSGDMVDVEMVSRMPSVTSPPAETHVAATGLSLSRTERGEQSTTHREIGSVLPFERGSVWWMGG